MKTKTDTTQVYIVLKSKFFRDIESGKKTVEYREFKKYWINKLLDHPIKTVRFNRGYSKDQMVFEVDEIGVIDGEYEMPAFDGEGNMNPDGKSAFFQPDTIAIHLGKRIS